MCYQLIYHCVYNVQLTDTIYVPEESVRSAKGAATDDVSAVVEPSSPSCVTGDNHFTDDEVSYLKISLFLQNS